MRSALFLALLAHALLPFAPLARAAEPMPQNEQGLADVGNNIDKHHIVGHYSGGPLHCAELAAVAATQPASDTTTRQRRALEALTVLHALADRTQAQDLLSDAEAAASFAAARERFLLARIQEGFSRDIEITPGEIEQTYKAHPKRFKRLERISTRLLLLRLPADADTAARAATTKRLQTIRQQILDGASFIEMARQHSEAENASRGGAVAASARGTLLPAFEKVAWELEEGALSDVVTLPDGLALILLEKRFPAASRTLAEARDAIEKRLRREKAEARRDAALDAARQRWPATVDWEKGLLPAAEAQHATIKIGAEKTAGETFTFADIGVRVHTPRRRAQVEEALERFWLARLAAEQLTAQDQAALGLMRLQTRAKPALGPLLDAALPAVPEAELRRLYKKGRNLFREPEKRHMTALIVKAEGGALREARQRALAARAAWQAGGAPPDTEALAPFTRETWGPLTRAMLDSHTSPRLAKRIFALEQGTISEPLKLERYDIGRIHFQPEGYVVLRTDHIEPARYKPFEAVRGRVHRYAVRDQLETLTAQIHAEVLAAAELEADPAGLASCPLPLPSNAAPVSSGEKANATPTAGKAPPPDQSRR